MSKMERSDKRRSRGFDIAQGFGKYLKESVVRKSLLVLMGSLSLLGNGVAADGTYAAQVSPAEFRCYAGSASRCLSPDLEVTVNGKGVDVRACRVSAVPYNIPWPGHQRPLDQSELASYLLVEGSGPANFAVTRKTPFKTCVIRPLSRGVKATVEGRTARFTLNAPGYFSVEFDGERHALHLFVEPVRDFLAEYGPPTRTFGPGVHFAGRIVLKRGDRVYLHRDAVVYGSLAAEDAEDVKVFGYGVIDAGIHERLFEHCYKRFQHNAFHAFDSRRLVLDGPVLLDSACWVCALFNCEDVDIRNLKICGQWRYNTDGIDVVNSRRVSVRNAFVRAFDDVLVVKGIPEYRAKCVEDVLFERCTVWCGWGNSLEIGVETTAPAIRRVTFRDCDVIRATGSTLDVEGGGEALIDGVTFENVRIERGRIPRMILDRDGGRTSWAESAGADRFAEPNLVNVNNRRFTWLDPKGEHPHGRIGKILFRDISVALEDGARQPPVRLRADDGSTAEFGEIRIENLTVDGRPVKDVGGLNLRDCNKAATANLTVGRDS